MRGAGGAISRPLSGLALRIFLATALVTAVALALALVVTGRRASRTADATLERALGATRTAVEDALDARSVALERVAVGLAGVPTYVTRITEALRVGDRAELLDQADEFRSQLDAAWVLITDREGTLAAWTRDRARSGEALGGGALVGQALAGETTRGFWVEPTAGGDSLFQAVGVPLLEPGGVTPQGVLVAALPIDAALAERLERQTASEVVFLSFEPSGRARIAVSTHGDALPAALRAGGGDSSARLLEVAIGGERWLGITGPLRTAGGEVVGEFVGLRSRSAELAAFTGFRNASVVAFLLALGVALVASLAVARRVSQPVRQLVLATRDVREGRFTAPLPEAGDDEIGELSRAFERMLRELKAKDDLVELLGSTRRSGPRESRGSVPPAGRLQPGAVVAERYEVTEVIGRGGMGSVHRALDLQLGETIALKTLEPALARDPITLSRFKQEIRLARRITHRNVVRTHDLGEADGLLFLTMEFVEGASLRKLLDERGRLQVPVVLTLGRQLCRALQAAHEQGVVHRDIKPENLLVAPDGTLKVTDFGIATLAERDLQRDGALTSAGMLIGTLRYMAPEQVDAEPVDGRTDLYQAGVVLFECLTGRELFPSTAMPELIMRIGDEPAPDPRNIEPTVPEGLARVVLKALAKRKEDRWESAAAMFEALEQVS